MAPVHSVFRDTRHTCHTSRECVPKALRLSSAGGCEKTKTNYVASLPHAGGTLVGEHYTLPFAVVYAHLMAAVPQRPLATQSDRARAAAHNRARWARESWLAACAGQSAQLDAGAHRSRYKIAQEMCSLRMHRSQIPQTITRVGMPLARERQQ